MYSEYNSINFKDGALKKVNLYRNELIAEIINYIFSSGKKSLNQISFEDINNKFANELHVRYFLIQLFTAGRIREHACEYYKANEI